MSDIPAPVRVTSPRIGSLFSGYGGLEIGVQAVIGGSVAWHVEFDPAPSKILAHRFPSVPNYGDITKVDWSAVEPVTVLAGGFPCQDLSPAGRMAGMRPGTRSGLWAYFLKAIDALRPELVVIENVRGLLSGCAESESDRDLGPCPRCADPKSRVRHAPNVRALGRVLLDVASIGYDAQWLGLRAANAGAPHGRFRVFVIAYPRDTTDILHERGGSVSGLRAGTPGTVGGSGGCAPEDTNVTASDQRRITAPGQTKSGRAWSHPRGRSGAPAADAERDRGERRRGTRDLAGTPGTGETDREQRERDGHAVDYRVHSAFAWGAYGPAIRRWESVLGRVAPSPTEPTGKDAAQRLSPIFVEWMMGLPDGWVTAPEVGLTRAQQLKALGNGVVPQQAELAVLTLLGVEDVAS